MGYNDTMRKDLPTVVYKNVLDQSDIDEIYAALDINRNNTFVEALSYTSYHIILPQHIIDKFTKIASEVAGIPLKINEYNLSRYEKTDRGGKVFNPILFPHTDEAFKEGRVTLDYQIKSNTDWSISVDNWKEEKEFTLADNELLTFGGTHQIHWRNKKEFKDGEFLEAIFMHFTAIPPQPLSSDDINETRERGLLNYNNWKNQVGPTQNIGNDETDLYKYKKLEDK
jgi:hypothetical protein